MWKKLKWFLALRDMFVSHETWEWMWLRNGLSLQTFIYNSILLTDLECYGEGFSLSADWFLIDFSDIPNCTQKFALIREQVMDINEMVAVTLDLSHWSYSDRDLGADTHRQK